MKKKITFCLFIALFSISQQTTFAFSKIDYFKNVLVELFVTLRAGTVVSVMTNEELSADDLQIGNSIDFLVRSNVTVNGQVVIATGAIAEGWVKKVSPSCDGRCSKVTITVENVQTVDGQRIYLRSIPHSVKIDCCRRKNKEEVVIPIGTNVSARVLNDVDINA